MSEPLSSFVPLDLNKPLLRRHATDSRWISTSSDKNVKALAKIVTWIETYVKIRPKDGPPKLLKLNTIQTILLQVVAWCWLNRIPVRLATPKSRQLGSSTWWEALFYALCELVPGYNAAIVAHTDDGATELFGKITTIKKGLRSTQWEESSLTNDQGSYLQWETESALWCATIKTGDALGKAGTLSGIHFSEVANFSDKKLKAEEAITSIVNSMAQTPRMFEIYESTAKGHDPIFYPICEAARNQESGSSIQLVFLPWFLDEGYRMKWGAYRRELLMAGKKDPGEKFEITYEEEILRSRLQNTVVEPHEQLYRYRVTLTDEQLIWRRWAIANKCGKIDQEVTFKRYYPSFYEECWTASSTSAFEQETIDHYREHNKPALFRGNLITLPGNRVVFEPDHTGVFHFWEEPQPGVEYVIGADVGGTTPRSDPHACYVVNKATLEQVAMLSGKWDELDYVTQLIALGYYYNTAHLAVENNHSPVVANEIFKRQYPRLYCYFVDAKHEAKEGKVPGWNTNKKTRPLLSHAVRVGLKSLRVVVNDPDFWEQMPTFVWVPFPAAANPEMEGEYKATGSNKDDKIMALAIALYFCDLEEEASPGQIVTDVQAHGKAYEFFLSLQRRGPGHNKPKML